MAAQLTAPTPAQRLDLPTPDVERVDIIQVPEHVRGAQINSQHAWDRAGRNQPATSMPAPPSASAPSPT